MDLYFWNAYKRLEKEVLELSEYIHISDGQLECQGDRSVASA